MGRHTIEQKQAKRRNQKRSRLRKSMESSVQQRNETSPSEIRTEKKVHTPPVQQVADDVSTSEESVYETRSSEISHDEDDAMCDKVHTPQQIGNRESDNGLFAALDHISEESDEYWDVMTQQKIKEFESYRDSHPCIITDKERSIRIFVDGTGRYKGTPAITRVAIEDYIHRLMKKDAKATELCQLMRDRIETLEDALKDSKVKVMKMHRENQRKIEKVRYFWRNKIFEGNSRGGELLKAALVYPEMYS